MNFVTGQRPLNWREGILLLYPNGKAPLTALTAAMKQNSTDDPEFNWWEKIAPTRRVVLSAAITNVQTNIPVVAGAFQYKIGDILMLEATGELMRVTSAPTVDTAITAVTRGFGGGTPAAVDPTTGNPNIIDTGSAYEEGSDAPSGVNFDPTKVRNYTQIFRNTLEATRTAMKTRLRTGDAVREAKRECLEMHSIDMERAFFFGKAIETTVNSKPARMTGGVLSFVDPSNVIDLSNAGAGTDMLDLENAMYTLFRYGSTEKVAFCGNRAALTINQIVRKNATMYITPGIKEYGMNIWRLTSPFGDLVVKSHPLFNQMTSGANYTGMEANLVVLDMAEIIYRNMADSDTKYETDLQLPGQDSLKSGYLTECGLEVHFPLAHGYVKGLTKAIKDP
jgi:hypothetical protein